MVTFQSPPVPVGDLDTATRPRRSVRFEHDREYESDVAVVDAPVATPEVVAEPQAMPDFRSLLASSIVTVSVVSFLLVFVATWWAESDAWIAAGVGLGSAVWIGPAFGVITAASRASAWFDRNGGLH